jgi:hypothetical protein
MSRAFAKDADGLEDLPDRPISEHPNDVTKDSGLCSAFASSHGARIHTSRSSSVVRITGIAFGRIGSTIAFGDVVRKP